MATQVREIRTPEDAHTLLRDYKLRLLEIIAMCYITSSLTMTIIVLIIPPLAPLLIGVPIMTFLIALTNNYINILGYWKIKRYVSLLIDSKIEAIRITDS